MFSLSASKLVTLLFGLLALVVSLIFFLSRRHKMAAPLAVATAELYQTRAIAEAKGKAEALMAEANVDVVAVDRLNIEISRRKAALTTVYKAAEMTTDEIVERFSNLSL